MEIGEKDVNIRSRALYVGTEVFSTKIITMVSNIKQTAAIMGVFRTKRWRQNQMR